MQPWIVKARDVAGISLVGRAIGWLIIAPKVLGVQEPSRWVTATCGRIDPYILYRYLRDPKHPI